MKKMYLLFMFVFCVVTGLVVTNTNAQQIDLNLDATNLVENYERLSEEMISYINSEGVTPVIGLDDGRTYNIMFALGSDQALNVTNEQLNIYYKINTTVFNGSDNQEWKFLREAHWEEGVYILVPQSHEDLTLGHYMNDSTGLAVLSHDNTQFKVIMNENGYYEFIIHNSSIIPNGFLGLNEGVTGNNPQVWINSDYNFDERQWYIWPQPEQTTQSSLRVLLQEKEEIQLSVTNNLTDNVNLIWWVSTDTSVAVVEDNGRVRGVSEGMAEILISHYAGQYQDFIPVLVLGEGMEDISISGFDVQHQDFMPAIAVVEGDAGDLRLALNLNVGENIRLFMNKDKDNVRWSSLDTNTAIVDNNGIVTAINEGLTIITAEYEGVMETIYVRVV